MIRFAIPLLLAGAFLSSSCSPATKKDEWDRYVLKPVEDRTKPPVFGEGLEGRMVDGKKVYTVQVEFFVSKEGQVAHAHVHRSDSPEKLQWAAVKAIKRLQFGPQQQPFRTRQTIIFNSLVVEPG